MKIKFRKSMGANCKIFKNQMNGPSILWEKTIKKI